MTRVLLLTAALLVLRAAAAVTLQELVGELSAACRDGAGSSDTAEDIRSAHEELEAALTTLQNQVTPAPAECPEGWSRHGRSCYLIPLAKVSWAEAQHHCALLDRRARLASVPADSFQFVHGLVRASTQGSWGAWLGLVRLAPGHVFGWSDGSPLGATDWNAEEPSGDGDCVHIWAPGHGSARGWNDLPCANVAYPLCQIVLK